MANCRRRRRRCSTDCRPHALHIHRFHKSKSVNRRWKNRNRRGKKNGSKITDHKTGKSQCDERQVIVYNYVCSGGRLCARHKNVESTLNVRRLGELRSTFVVRTVVHLNSYAHSLSLSFPISTGICVCVWKARRVNDRRRVSERIDFVCQCELNMYVCVCCRCYHSLDAGCWTERQRKQIKKTLECRKLFVLCVRNTDASALASQHLTHTASHQLRTIPRRLSENYSVLSEFSSRLSLTECGLLFHRLISFVLCNPFNGFDVGGRSLLLSSTFDRRSVSTFKQNILSFAIAIVDDVVGRSYLLHCLMWFFFFLLLLAPCRAFGTIPCEIIYLHREFPKRDRITRRTLGRERDTQRVYCRLTAGSSFRWMSIVCPTVFFFGSILDSLFSSMCATMAATVVGIVGLVT